MMENLYAKDGAAPAPLPHIIYLSDGRPRSSQEPFTEQEVAEAGYIEAPPVPEHEPATQHRPVWDGSGWTVRNKTPEDIAAEFANAKSAALAHVSQKRWEIETGGILFRGTIPIRTDEVGQAKITGALALMDKDPELLAIDWEGQPGVWATIDKLTIEAVGIAVGRHIQACFSRARVISEAVQRTNTATELDSACAEIEVGWPD